MNPLRELAAKSDYGYRVVTSRYITKTVVKKRWFTTGELIIRGFLFRLPFSAYREVHVEVPSEKVIINDKDRVIMCHPFVYQRVIYTLRKGRL